MTKISRIKVWAFLGAVIAFIGFCGLGYSAAAAAEAFPGVKPVKSYAVVAGKTYKLPDGVKKTGDTYYTSDNRIITVVKDTGNFTAKATGTAYIIAANSGQKRYFKVTVAAAEAPKAKSALDGYPVTVANQTTLAAKARSFTSNGVYAMYFLSADEDILGSIPMDTYRAIVQPRIDHGTLKEEDANKWMAEQFNLFRGLKTNNQPTDDPKKVGTAAYAQEVIRLTNLEREKAGYRTLTADPYLMGIAQKRAEELETKFSHERPDGTNALDMFTGSRAENISMGAKTPKDAVSGWMNSEGHKKNILNDKYSFIGVGCYQDANGKLYWVQLFSSKQQSS